MEEKIIPLLDDVKQGLELVWRELPCLNPLELCQWRINVFNELVLKRGNNDEI